MALDFTRYNRDGEPVAPVAVKMYVDRKDLIAAASVLATRRERISRKAIDETIRDFMLGYGVSATEAMEDTVDYREWPDVGEDPETVIENIVYHLFPEVAP